MGNGTYQLILEGAAEGFDLQEVKEKLAAFFKMKPEKMDTFFQGRPVVVKKGLDKETALKYKSVFELAGAACRIEGLEEEDEIPAHMIEELEGDDGEDDIPAHMIEDRSYTEEDDDIPAHMIEDGEYTKKEEDILAHTIEGSTCASEARVQESMVCPKCDYKQEKARTCVRCGVVVEKFLKLVEKKAKEGEEEGIEHEMPKVVLGIDRKFYEQAAEAEKKVTDQAGFINNLLSDGRRLVFLGAMAFFVLLGFFEFFILRGDLVAKDSIRIDRRSDYIAILVDHPYQEYLVEVSTGKKQRKLSFLLEDPLGRIIYEESEYSLYKGSRRFTFEPEERGTYTLYINDGAIGFGEQGYARVRVYMNDNRILGRVLGFLNF
ncbi:MAG: hypothetical protein JSW56_16580 [Deltaproteobacteria bacterium]|nr:MAG: hypothetical protein JSW56_16580 [Deltaproteobacteria bacterium]